MSRYGVLIVDDSAFMRRAVSLLFDKDPEFYIVGIARNGIEAIEKLQRFRPDVVTLDVEMPEMDGIAALEQIMRDQPVPVVMLSNQTGEGTQATIRALQLGAVDFFLKDELFAERSDDALSEDFLARMKVAAEAKVYGKRAQYQPEENERGPVRERGGEPSYDLLVIGCSTGGPSALQSILPRFPQDFPASIVVVQHMPPGFTGPLAERFNTICQLRVKEAADGDPLEPGTIYVASAGYQTTVQDTADKKRVLRVREDSTSLYKPSVNVTLESVAPIYKERTLAAVLTGMGNDGLDGCRRIKENGGRVLVEAEETCIVYGMPKVIFEAGLADRQSPLPRIYHHMISFL
ncbi:chemotaxis response regulator protein-glutamate methylesterase [Paenibacillus sp. TRM 82003]|nr:chemotaxis response regulator protein-glutamate methylesterase [Paenibacillus sp. TRM 82003]